MEQVVKLAEQLDFANLLVIAGMFWFFYTRLDAKIDRLEDKIEKVEGKFDNRFDKLEEKITDIDRRLCRLEGAFSNKDCCMIKDDRQVKKAE